MFKDWLKSNSIANPLGRPLYPNPSAEAIVEFNLLIILLPSLWIIKANPSLYFSMQTVDTQIIVGCNIWKEKSV